MKKFLLTTLGLVGAFGLGVFVGRLIPDDFDEEDEEGKKKDFDCANTDCATCPCKEDCMEISFFEDDPTLFEHPTKENTDEVKVDNSTVDKTDEDTFLEEE